MESGINPKMSLFEDLSISNSIASQDLNKESAVALESHSATA